MNLSAIMSSVAPTYVCNCNGGLWAAASVFVVILGWFIVYIIGSKHIARVETKEFIEASIILIKDIGNVGITFWKSEEVESEGADTKSVIFSITSQLELLENKFILLNKRGLKLEFENLLLEFRQQITLNAEQSNKKYSEVKLMEIHRIVRKMVDAVENAYHDKFYRNIWK